MEDIYRYYEDSDESLRSIFKVGTSFYDEKLIGLNTEEVIYYLNERLLDLQMTCTFFVLAEIEAIFRTDYLNRSLRARRPKADQFSKHMRKIYKRKLNKASFEEDILASWKIFYPELSNIIGEIKGVLNLRNWLAHGRYYTAKFGRNYDYTYIRILAEEITREFSFIK